MVLGLAARNAWQHKSNGVAQERFKGDVLVQRLPDAKCIH